MFPEALVRRTPFGDAAVALSFVASERRVNIGDPDDPDIARFDDAVLDIAASMSAQRDPGSTSY